jgi:glycosyltransferase involved in cell wall biosynthesis
LSHATKLNKSIKIRSSKNIKVLVIPGWYPSKRSPQNGDFIKYQTDMLRHEGLTIDLVHADISIQNYQNLLSPNTPNYIVGKHEFTSRYWSIPRRGNTGMNSWRKKFVLEVLKYIDQIGSPDIIHAHTYLGGWVAMEIKQQLDIPYIITEHSTQVLEGRLSSSHNEIASDAYRHADAVVAVGQALADVINTKYGTETRVIPNFINTDLFNIPEHKSGPSDKLELIAIGDLIKRKDFDKLIKACKQLQVSYHLSIVGDGPEKAALIQMVKSANVDVTFLGRQSQKEISELLKQAHLLVHPSTSETFGIILIEAMASGVPVVSFNNGGAEDIIRPNTGVLLNNNGESDLTTAIESVYNNYTDYKPKDIRQVVIDRFSSTAIAPQLIELYTSLTG